jgi:hypothetical protein
MKQEIKEVRVEISEGEPIDISVEDIDSYFDSLIESQSNKKVKQALKLIKEQPTEIKTKWLTEDDPDDIETRAATEVGLCIFFVIVVVIVTYYVVTIKTLYPPPPKKPYKKKIKEKRTREEKRKKKVVVEANEDGTCDAS